MKKPKKAKKISIKVRRTWAINPVTRVVKDPKKYDRQRIKKSLRKILNEEA